MESRPVRLGWLSLLLTVIILCLATLSVLSFPPPGPTLHSRRSRRVRPKAFMRWNARDSNGWQSWTQRWRRPGIRRSWMRCCRTALPGKAPV